VARGLRERGVKKGERVAVSLGNGWEFAVITYSLFKLGAILVSRSISGMELVIVSVEDPTGKTNGIRLIRGF